MPAVSHRPVRHSSAPAHTAAVLPLRAPPEAPREPRAPVDVYEPVSTTRAANPLTPGERDAGLVLFSSDASLTRLARSKARANFAALSMQFEPQTNNALCGVASGVIVLNALRMRDAGIEKPRARFPNDEAAARIWTVTDTIYARRYTQTNLFDIPAVQAVKTLSEVVGLPGVPGAAPNPGLDLDELGAVLRATGVRARTVHADEPRWSKAAARQEIIDALGTPGRHVIVNYGRPGLGQTGGGHFSPLAAYDAVSGSVLIVDVNPSMRAWVWAPLDKLLDALHGGRGYLVVEEGAPRSAFALGE
jgi:hypothetical protein